jgi:hypothetical protein
MKRMTVFAGHDQGAETGPFDPIQLARIGLHERPGSSICGFASRIDELMPCAWAAEHSANKLAA